MILLMVSVYHPRDPAFKNVLGRCRLKQESCLTDDVASLWPQKLS